MIAPTVQGRRWYGAAAFTCFGLLVSLTSLIGAQLAQQSQGQDLVAPVTSELCRDMVLRHVLRPNGPVGCDRLNLIRFSYIDFDEKPQHDGELVVMDAAAPHVLNIFISLRQIRFPIRKAKLMNRYNGNDDASMADNNTSAFNDRQVYGATSISLHAYGLAIDINPVQNPFMRRSKDVWTVAPPASAEYVNRFNDRPWNNPRPGLAEPIIDIFAENGFLIWGGYWDNPIDYQHFQVGRKMAERLARASSREAAEMFTQMVERYRACRQAS